MPLSKEIEGMKRRIADGESDVQAGLRHIRYLVDQGMDSSGALRDLAQLRRAQQSREEMLDLANVFSALTRDPKKG